MDNRKLPANLPPLHSPLWLPGGHLQTVYAKLLQRTPPPYRRELLPDSGGSEQAGYDFVDAADAEAPLVVLFHGLEGSSGSHYAVEMMYAIRQRGWHGVVAHFRSCGGVPAEKKYHSGDTREIAHMLGLLAARYRRVYAVGISLGGNALAKYLGEQGRAGQAAVPQAAAAVSAPVDLPASAAALEHGLPRLLYTRYFLNSLLPKMPPLPDVGIRTLGDFDNAYTAPLHGFADKDDYYRRSAAKPYLRDIAVPTLLLNARNDPFLPARFLPPASLPAPTRTGRPCGLRFRRRPRPPALDAANRTALFRAGIGRALKRNAGRFVSGHPAFTATCLHIGQPFFPFQTASLCLHNLPCCISTATCACTTTPPCTLRQASTARRWARLFSRPTAIPASAFSCGRHWPNCAAGWPHSAFLCTFSQAMPPMR